MRGHHPVGCALYFYAAHLAAACLGGDSTPADTGDAGLGDSLEIPARGGEASTPGRKAGGRGGSIPLGGEAEWKAYPVFDRRAGLSPPPVGEG